MGDGIGVCGCGFGGCHKPGGGEERHTRGIVGGDGTPKFVQSHDSVRILRGKHHSFTPIASPAINRIADENSHIRAEFDGIEIENIYKTDCAAVTLDTISIATAYHKPDLSGFGNVVLLVFNKSTKLLAGKSLCRPR